MTTLSTLIRNTRAALARRRTHRRHYAKVLRELQSYNGRELRDLGVDAADLATLAWAEADRRLALAEAASVRAAALAGATANDTAATPLPRADRAA